MMMASASTQLNVTYCSLVAITIIIIILIVATTSPFLRMSIRAPVVAV